MSSFFKKPIIIAVVVVVAIGAFAFFSLQKKPVVETPKPIIVEPVVVKKTIGTSVQGRKILSYTYGNGDKHIAFVGGIHGGYEWNGVLLAYQLMDYLDKNPTIIPDNLTVTVIPSANPDGVLAVTGKEGSFSIADVSTSSKTLAAGRFNAHNVDLNRNFDCKWQPKSTWQTKATSAGTSAFSEPEAVAIKNFVLSSSLDAVVFFHSASNAVYASECKKGILPETLNIMNAYAQASGYSAVKTFDAYAVTGDAEGWLASINIPAITVELKTHDAIEWDKNVLGVRALFRYFSSEKIKSDSN